MASKKFYVVWKGRNPGIYDNWTDCQAQVHGFEGAEYKSFKSENLADQAFLNGSSITIKNNSKKEEKPELSDDFMETHNIIANSLSVDAACSGNPGKMEYQGVFTATGTECFRVGPYEDGTNNIGEFLALVHGLAWLKKEKLDLPIYSDSRNAILWVKKKKCNTKLKVTGKNDEIFNLIKRAEYWLKTNSYSTEILKWETKVWGEIPADFGRK